MTQRLQVCLFGTQARSRQRKLVSEPQAEAHWLDALAALEEIHQRLGAQAHRSKV